MGVATEMGRQFREASKNNKGLKNSASGEEKQLKSPRKPPKLNLEGGILPGSILMFLIEKRLLC